jgi:glycyl-tRNA synthetase beta subunit
LAVNNLVNDGAFLAAYKRAFNITKDVDTVRRVARGLLKEDAERELHLALKAAAKQLKLARRVGDYAGAIETLSALGTKVAEFFASGIRVNADHERTRANRLALLGNFVKVANWFCDFSQLLVI